MGQFSLPEYEVRTCHSIEEVKDEKVRVRSILDSDPLNIISGVVSVVQ